MKAKTNVVLYMRVAQHTQGNPNGRIVDQKAILMEYAAKNNLSVASEHYSLGAGAPTNEGFRELVQFIREWNGSHKDSIQNVLVTDRCRLSRSYPAYMQMEEELEKLGVTVRPVLPVFEINPSLLYTTVSPQNLTK
jgi:DNA invertase Pin-like site-specific DNA recombinase